VVDTTFTAQVTPITANWLNYVNKQVNTFVTPVDPQFGAVGDGTTDDTVAIQAFFQYMADNGGVALLGDRNYKITAPLVLTNPTHGFAVFGGGPEYGFIYRTTSDTTVLSIVAPHDILLDNIYFDCGHSVTGFSSHGISMRNAQRVTVRQCRFYDFKNSAGLTFVDADDTYGDCHFINCIADGNSNGQNGFLHEGMLRSSLQNCTVRRLSLSGTPCNGLQLKNRCKHSWIDGGFASECKAGVAMGGDGATFGDGPFNCWIRGVITKDCWDGGIFGKSTDCTIEYAADMTNSPAPSGLQGYALNVAGSNVNLSARVSIKGVQSGRTSMLIRSTDVSVYIPYINGYGTTLYEMTAGVRRCRVVVQDAFDSITNLNDLVTDNSGQTDNELLFVRDLPGGGLAGSNFIKMPVVGKTQNWMSFSGATDTFAWRIDGTDRLGLNTTQLFPSQDVTMTAGTSSKRFTNVFSQGLTLVDGVTAPATIAGHAVIYVDTADGDLKVKFADGTVKTIVVDT